MLTPLSRLSPFRALASPSPETRWSDERNRVDGARDSVRAGPGGVEGGGEPTPGSALAEDADGQAALRGERRDELVRPRSLECPGRVVEQDARGTEVGELLGLLEHLLRLPAALGAVDEARVELAARPR